MLELDFNVFMEHYEKQKKLRNEDFRKLHYEQLSDSFKLYLKSADYWEYFTTISFDSIVEFGSQYEVTREQTIDDFKVNFLTDAMPVNTEVVEVKELPDELTKELKPFEAEEAKPYDDFLISKFKEWERKILGFVDETLEHEIINKSFGDFMRRLFNVVNTADFRAKIKSSIKKVFVDGIEEAELEVNVDVGFDADFANEVDVQTDRQLDGFMIEGKMWSGIRGVSVDVQREIRELVVKSIESKASMKELKTDIKKTMDKFTGTEIKDGRATAIARTESNRMRNASKQKAYEKSGVVKGKKWNSFIDDRTSPICKRLDNQKVSLNKNFIDPKTGFEYDHAPAYTNCRSVLSPILLDEEINNI